MHPTYPGYDRPIPRDSSGRIRFTSRSRSPARLVAGGSAKAVEAVPEDLGEVHGAGGAADRGADRGPDRLEDRGEVGSTLRPDFTGTIKKLVEQRASGFVCRHSISWHNPGAEGRFLEAPLNRWGYPPDVLLFGRNSLSQRPAQVNERVSGVMDPANPTIAKVWWLS